MTLSAIIMFVISAPKYNNILIDNKIGGLSLSELYPKLNELYKTYDLYAFIHAISILHCNLFITLLLRRTETFSSNEFKIIG